MGPSPPAGEVVSVNFWYPPPLWFYGDPAAGDITWDRPLFGVKRVLFSRCVEELVGQTLTPAEVTDVVEICIGSRPFPLAGSKTHEAVQNILTFVSTVFPDADECQAFL